MTPKQKTVLVTGGAGYIGSHCVIDLQNANYNVIVVDNLVNSYMAANAEKPEVLLRIENQITKKPVTFYQTDIRDIEAMDAIFKKHDISAVLHFAALKSPAESIQDPVKYYDFNVGGSNALIKVMIKNNVKRLIFSSSATVYGPPKYLPVDEAHPVGQGITNPYGKTKYFMEEIFQDVCKSKDGDNWSVILLRYFNPVGSHPSGLIGEDPKDPYPANLMPYVSRVAVGVLPHLNVTGNDYPTKDGTGVRDYIHISDLISGHIAALEKAYDSNGCNIYNLGTGRGYSVLEAVAAFEKASGKKVEYKIAPRRPGDLADVHAVPDKAFNELGWKAKYDLEDMCVDLWRWQEANPFGFSGADLGKGSEKFEKEKIIARRNGGLDNPGQIWSIQLLASSIIFLIFISIAILKIFRKYRKRNTRNNHPLYVSKHQKFVA